MYGSADDLVPRMQAMFAARAAAKRAVEGAAPVQDACCTDREGCVSKPQGGPGGS